MRIAICSGDMDERFALSRLVDDALIRRGRLTELTLFPLLPELREVTARMSSPFALVLIEGEWDASAVSSISSRAPVILVGGRNDGPVAFEAGASYFVEGPASLNDIDRALARCLCVADAEEIY